MEIPMTTLDDAHEVVRHYSTTWYEPVMAMPPKLNEAVTCAYLLMRGIDEIEDHPELDVSTKVSLLNGFSLLVQRGPKSTDFGRLWAGQETVLPDVTVRMDEWVALAPPEIAPRVWDTFATMAERMAGWADSGFGVVTAESLDRYTYAVAGTLGLLLSDLWSWYDGTKTDRTNAVGYGRALQLVNILVDRDEDLGRDVDFWPRGWTAVDMISYATRELVLADAYVTVLPSGPARTFCTEPLARARHALLANTQQRLEPTAPIGG
jgi:farnesyl-diphosphate farnesyltransferase